MNKLVLATVAAISALTLTACDSFDQANGRGDAAINVRDNSGAEIVNFPDTYGNLATKCSHGHRLFSTTHGSNDDMTEYASQIWVIPDDPTCPREPAQ